MHHCFSSVRRIVLVLVVLAIGGGCDTSDVSCEAPAPGPDQITLCLSGDIDASATLDPGGVYPFDVVVVESQGRTDDGASLALALIVAADEVSPGTYPVEVRDEITAGTGTALAVLPDAFEDVRDLRAISGDVVVEAVVVEIAGRFSITFEDRTGRETVAVGRFRAREPQPPLP